jgi:hypothetical protein
MSVIFACAIMLRIAGLEKNSLAIAASTGSLSHR